MFENGIDILFWTALGLLNVGAAALVSTTLFNVLRLRNVRLSWKAGKLKGYPLFASLFILFATIAAVVAYRNGQAMPIAATASYLWFGICWFTTSFFATKHFITDHGIVKNVNAPAQTVPWHQIRDFVELEGVKGTNYIFIYETEDNPNLIRLEVEVPRDSLKDFQKIISHKLGRRIRCYVDEQVSLQHLKQQ